MNPYAILSTDNLIHNIKTIKNNTKAEITVMLKANGYGHGLRSVATRIEKYVDYLGVARLEEGLALRQIGIKNTIVIMQGIYKHEDALICYKNNFIVVIHSIEQLNAINTALDIWLKIDTGMGRLGFLMQEAQSIYTYIKNKHNINIKAIISHFSAADDYNQAVNIIQINNMKLLMNWFPEKKSFCNSAAIWNFTNLHCDIVRPGLAVYGISPIKGSLAYDLGLKPVMTLMTYVIARKMIPKGHYIGYGGKFKAEQNMHIAIIALGYGDGYPREISSHVNINNKKCKIIGIVSMDMMAVDIGNNDVKIGDEVIIWGMNGPSVEEVAYSVNYIPYQLITAIQNRVKFYWQ
jgi:alanine racemase